MPGAPNRPPDVAGPAPAAPPADERERRVLRRLVPSKVALKLDLWKGTPPADLFTPYDRAERAFDARDLAAAETALDLLAVRFAEPRWPTLPAPFRELRVEIVQPQPPNWNPELKLEPAEQERLKARRVAERQLALATGALEWAAKHQVAVDDLTPSVELARSALQAGGPDQAFWSPVDALWGALRPRIPPPTSGPPRSTPPPASEPAPAAGSS